MTIEPVKSAYGLAFDKYIDEAGMTPEEGEEVREHFWAGWIAQKDERDILCCCSWCGLGLGVASKSDDSQVKERAREHSSVCPEHPLNKPLPCGHPARYAYPPTGDEGTTHYCIACLLDGDPQSTAKPEDRQHWRMTANKYADKVDAENAALKARVAELEHSRLDEALALLKQVAALEKPMTCGHPGRFIFRLEGGKSGCAICIGTQQAEEMDRYWKAVGLLDPNISIDHAIQEWQKREKKLAILREALDRYADPGFWGRRGPELAEDALIEVDEMDKE